jgi:hypothetical protein
VLLCFYHAKNIEIFASCVEGFRREINSNSIRIITANFDLPFLRVLETHLYIMVHFMQTSGQMMQSMQTSGEIVNDAM